MSSDARDSVGMLVSVVGMFGLFWAALHYGWFDGLSNTWVGVIGGLLGAVNLAIFAHGLAAPHPQAANAHSCTLVNTGKQ